MGLGEAGAARWRGGAATQRAVVMKGGGQTAGRCAGPAQLSGAPDLGASSARSRRDLGAISARAQLALAVRRFGFGFGGGT